MNNSTLECTFRTGALNHHGDMCSSVVLLDISKHTRNVIFDLSLPSLSNLKSVYQEYMAKALQDKYNETNGQMDNLVREANTEIASLRDKIASLQTESQVAKRKNLDITEALQDKTRQFHKLQVTTTSLYDLC